MSKRSRREDLAPLCGAHGGVAHPGRGRYRCSAITPNGARCRVVVRGRYEVSGSDAKDVLAVMKEAHRQRLREHAPWRAGLFYLLCLAVVTVILLAVVRQVTAWLVPVV